MPKRLPAVLRAETISGQRDFPEALRGLELLGPILSAARALSGLHVDDIARLAMLGPATVRRAEASKTTLTPGNLDRLVRAYADLGVSFVLDEHGRRGVIIEASDWLKPQSGSPATGQDSTSTSNRSP